MELFRNPSTQRCPCRRILQIDLVPGLSRLFGATYVAYGSTTKQETNEEWHNLIVVETRCRRVRRLTRSRRNLILPSVRTEPRSICHISIPSCVYHPRREMQIRFALQPVNDGFAPQAPASPSMGHWSTWLSLDFQQLFFSVHFGVAQSLTTTSCGCLSRHNFMFTVLFRVILYATNSFHVASRSATGRRPTSDLSATRIA